MSLLSFEKPQKIRSTEEHNKMYSSDCGIAGAYTPNMSVEDMNKWKAKYIKDDNERIEIRKTFSSTHSSGAQLLVIIYKEPYKNGQELEYPNYDSYINRNDYWDAVDEYNKFYDNWHNDIHISMNGKLQISFNEYKEFQEAINEAIAFLKRTE